MSSLLPVHYTQKEKDIESVFKNRFLNLKEEIGEGSFLNPSACDVKWLPLLSDFYGGLISYESDKSLREQIVAIPKIRRKLGTVDTVKKALKAFLIDDFELVEGVGSNILDGSWKLDGSVGLGTNAFWSYFSLKIGIKITNKRAEQLRIYIEKYKPIRSKLKRIDYVGRIKLDGSWKMNGEYNLGRSEV